MSRTDEPGNDHRLIGKEMGMAKDPDGRALALNYMTQMVNNVTQSPMTRRKRLPSGDDDMTYAYLDGYNDAVKSPGHELSKKEC